MMFSQRKGFLPVRNTVQKEDMDEALRYGLWDALHLCLWERVSYDHYDQDLRSSNLYRLFQQYWHSLFKIPIDSLPEYLDEALRRIRKIFFEFAWYQAYDFIEFTAVNSPEEFRDDFVKFCNLILERELSAYRFVDFQLVDITSEEEVESIEAAIAGTAKYSGAKQHIQTALRFLSDRKSPDFRNSIKESICAVESLCVSISGDPKATLGAALTEIERTHRLHPSFKKALSSLYGYTSDSSGIRHALLDESTVSYSDAKFMLVACSAFTNYVLGKVSEKH